MVNVLAKSQSVFSLPTFLCLYFLEDLPVYIQALFFFFPFSANLGNPNSLLINTISRAALPISASVALDYTSRYAVQKSDLYLKIKSLYTLSFSSVVGTFCYFASWVY